MSQIVLKAVANLYNPSCTPKEEMYKALYDLALALYDETEDEALQVAGMVEILDYITYNLPQSLMHTTTPPIGYVQIRSLFPNLVDKILVAVAPVLQNKQVFKKLKKKLQPVFLSTDIHSYKGDPIDKFLGGTPFKTFFNAYVPFSIPLKTFASHGIIVAPPNTGKSQLLGSFICRFLKENNPPGLVLIDPHGDLFNQLCTRVDPKRLIILDPDTDPPALNFLDFGKSTQVNALQTFTYLMASLSGGLSDKQGAIVPYLFKLVQQIPNANITTLKDIVDEKIKKGDVSKFAPFIHQLHPIDQGFFENQFYGSSMQVTKDAIGWKLYSALASDTFRDMFTATSNTFSADKAMQEGKVVLVKGASRSLGLQGMSIYLQFIISQYFGAALRRENIPENQRRLCILIIDEAHHVFNSQTSNILSECRKYGLGFLAATQFIQQIPDDVKAAIYGATAIKIAGAVAHNDAMVLSREMFTTADFIRSMRSYERAYAEWACHVANQTPQAIKLGVAFGALDKLPQTDPLTFEAMLRANKMQYGATPPEPAREPSQPPPPPHENVKKPPPEPLKPKQKSAEPKLDNSSTKPDPNY
jgi:hypothetical protein